MNQHHPVILIILDGWGHREAGEHNAIALARTPFFDSLMEKYPHTLLNASEEHVGLPQGTIGNSEIGHMTMGAGRIIDTDLVRISKAAAAGQFNTNPAFLGLFEHVKKFHSNLHIIGLVSQAGVHSHQQHLHDFLAAAKAADINNIYIHAITDGRDSTPQGAAGYLEQLEKIIADLGIGFIATATGRYYALDRDKNWERTDKAVSAMFKGVGTVHNNKKPSAVVKELYQTGAIDEYLEPQIFLDDAGQAYPVGDNDGVFFFNFRSDRPRQLAQKIAERAKTQNLYFVTLTEYHPALQSTVAFPPNKIDTTLAAEISQAGLTQAHIAETEKYAHVTFFFNGGKQEPYSGEKQILVDSRHDIATHDLAPEMRAKEITDKALEELQAGTDFILINYANADIVGHTANVPAIVKAVETIDAQLKRLVPAALAKNGTVIITADHGNAELNYDEASGHKHTAHTTNLVPFILVSKISLPPPMGEGRGEGAVLKPKTQNLKPSPGTLSDLAPTILSLLNLKIPASMTGKNLIG